MYAEAGVKNSAIPQIATSVLIDATVFAYACISLNLFLLFGIPFECCVFAAVSISSLHSTAVNTSSCRCGLAKGARNVTTNGLIYA